LSAKQKQADKTAGAIFEIINPLYYLPLTKGEMEKIETTCWQKLRGGVLKMTAAEKGGGQGFRTPEQASPVAGDDEGKEVAVVFAAVLIFFYPFSFIKKRKWEEKKFIISV